MRTMLEMVEVLESLNDEQKDYLYFTLAEDGIEALLEFYECEEKHIAIDDALTRAMAVYYDEL